MNYRDRSSSLEHEFDAPAIEARKSTLIELDRQQIDTIVQTVPGGEANVEDIYPLSALQAGMLFHHLLNEQRDTYMLSTLFELQSDEETAALVIALQAVIDRHAVLRSAVLWEKLPQAVQVVYRRARLPVEEVTIELGVDVVEEIKERMKPGRQSLNLRQAPLLKLQQFKATDRTQRERYALLQLHHIICDKQSWDAVVAEALAYLQGRGHHLPTPEPYRSYVAWALAHTRVQEAEDFFRCRLGEIEEPTAPFCYVNAHGDLNQVEESRRRIELPLAQRVRIQARRLGVGASRLFHAAWALVIARTSGCVEAVFGTVLGTKYRSAPQLRMLGLNVNTLPLRIRLEHVSSEELIQQAHQELLELRNFDSAELTLAQRCSGIANSAPLFTALLNFRRGSEDPNFGHGDGHGVRVIASAEAWTNYPIALTVDDSGEHFLMTVQTDRNIDAARIAGYMHAAVQSLVGALEEAPHTPALSLSILPSGERREVIESFNATRVEYPEQTSIHELFHAQARLTPARVALLHGEETLTYEQLNGKANQLARYLGEKGVGPGGLVGICIERSLDMVVGLLGILKAGAAYVPLDPNYPPERLRYMLEDVAPQAVLTQRKLRAVMPDTSATIIELQEQWSDIARRSDQDAADHSPGAEAGSRVYVIYTSGSTGRPKGTEMPHRAMVNLIEWHRHNLCAEERRVLQFAALSFDVAFQEIFSTLCTGGTLVLLDEAVRRDARALLNLIDSQAVDRLFLPPLMLQSLAEYCSSTGTLPATLKDIITAGEQLRISEEIKQLFRRLDGCRLHNHYGPTETHVVTALVLDGDPAQWPVLPSIGQAIANTQIYILDRQQAPLPIAVPGEVCIGGANVALGYLNRTELTAERFVKDPFSSREDGRMYRTGDVGRWRADGTIEYLGRNDDQVKIRGFRIELGEIEAQLARHAQVREGAVVAREEVLGEKRLVAYVTLRAPGGADAEELRAHLRASLPEHMVPGALVILENMPLTPSGKLNRRALPAPDMSSFVSYPYESPQGEMEKALAVIWQELLHVSRVGREANFFELGGDSLLAMKLSVKIADRFDVPFHVPAVLRKPSLRDMAQSVSELLLAIPESSLSAEWDIEEGII